MRNDRGRCDARSNGDRQWRRAFATGRADSPIERGGDLNRLDAILERTQRDLADRRRVVSLAEVRTQAAIASSPRGFAAAVVAARARGAAIIAEVKRASPSRGAIAPLLDPAQLARDYQAGGAAALSVLTDGPHFGGSLDDLRAARAACAIPVLRKDFMIDAYQVYEARAAGADALLLIAAALERTLLIELRSLARELSLDVLIEVHEESELAAALDARPDLLGINNRNLKTFDVDLGSFERLSALLPRGVAPVAESGIRSGADLRRLSLSGAGAFLIGESLSGSQNPRAATAAFVEALRPLAFPRANEFSVKICGVTSIADAQLCVDAGADAIGCVLESRSKRATDLATLASVANAVGDRAAVIAVFDHAAASDIVKARAAGATHAQLFSLEGAALDAVALPVIFCARIEGNGLVHDVQARAAGACALLLDGAGAATGGGGGRVFDWSAARETARGAGLPIIVAGGLTADNVTEAICTLLPVAVDVASGTESAPGKKDPARVRAFVAAARSAQRGSP